MKINLIKDIVEFFDVVDKCKGEVVIVSDEGDRIALKSKLCRFILTVMIEREDDILLNLEVKTEFPEDAAMLLDYAMRQ